MVEIFKPRENMKEDSEGYWTCRDENGRLVCDGGPSAIWDDGKNWHFWSDLRGAYHRVDGPIMSTCPRWYIQGKDVTWEIHQFAKENSINLDNLTDADKVLIALKFG